MLGKATCIGLGIRRSELEPCPFQIQTSLGGTNDRSHFMTHERLLVQLRPDHATNSFRLGVIVVVTITKSYDVLLEVSCCIRWVFKWIIGWRHQLIDLVGSRRMDI
jgi:hypothetical protein